MPGMDGIQTMKRIKQTLPNFSDSKTIALTAYALPEEKQSFLQQGFDGLVTKPIDEAKLIATLCTHLPDCKHAQLEDIEQDATLSSKKNKTLIRTGDQEAIVDIEEGIILCNGNTELASDLLSRLLNRLPSDKTEIQTTYETHRSAALEAAIHKLHGACHYCGVPMLRAAAKEAEHALKRQLDSSDMTIIRLLSQIDAVIAWDDKN